MNTINQNRILNFGMIILITVMNACKSDESQVKETPGSALEKASVQLTDAQYKNASLTLGKPEIMEIGNLISLHGKIEVMPENSISISSPVSGFVRSIKWMPGMDVAKGQVLLRLEDQEFVQLQQDYLSAKNAFSFAKLDFERQKELSKNQAASEKVLQQAEEKLRQYQITINSLSEKLKLIHLNPSNINAENMTSQIILTSPVNGAITSVSANNGKYVQKGEEVFRIIDQSGSRLVLKAFEKDWNTLVVGQKLMAYSNNRPEFKIPGKIDYIVKDINDEGFARIICSLNKTKDVIIPGSYMNAVIDAQSTSAWVLPESAIVGFEGKEYLFVESGDKMYEMIEVTPGLKENGKIQIINFNVIKDKQVVVKGAYTLLMKMKNIAE